jgi:hypothetical protein
MDSRLLFRASRQSGVSAATAACPRSVREADSEECDELETFRVLEHSVVRHERLAEPQGDRSDPPIRVVGFVRERVPMLGRGFAQE